MVQLIIMIVFFVVLAVAGVVAAMAGRLPTAKQLAAQDEARFAQYKRALRS
jgi:Flp pilus assembly protein CpaB